MKINRTCKSDTKNEKTPRLVARGVLETASFVCGAMVMVVEMAGSRLLAPWMGSSVIVWTSLIGIILAFLSLGYWLGGKFADKSPAMSSLSKIITAAALSVAILALAANLALSAISGSIHNLYAASVVAAITLFSVPSVALGMVSPMIMRIALENEAHIGATVGRFSALSCIGSILGTFLGGFVLISLFSTGTILLLTAAILAAVALITGLDGMKKKKITPGLGAIMLISLSAAVFIEINGMPMASAGIHIETPYNHIRIFEGYESHGSRLTRILQTDPVGSQSAMYIDAPNEHVFDYTKFYDLAFFYRPEIERALMLGGGGYTIPKNIMVKFPHIAVDVVELDAGMTEVAKKYFALSPNENMRIFHEDARTFINRAPTAKKYDAVFWDVFTSEYNIPFHLTTIESIRRASELLSDDGITIVNIISAAEGPMSGIFKGIYASFAEVFPHVKIFLATYPQYPELRQNVILMASKAALEKENVQGEQNEQKISALLANELKRPVIMDVAPFRDAYAPVEYHALKMR